MKKLGIVGDELKKKRTAEEKASEKERMELFHRAKGMCGKQQAARDKVEIEMKSYRNSIIVLRHNFSQIPDTTFEFFQDAYKQLMKSRSHLKWGSIVSFLYETEYNDNLKNSKKKNVDKESNTNIKMLQLN